MSDGQVQQFRVPRDAGAPARWTTAIAFKCGQAIATKGLHALFYRSAIERTMTEQNFHGCKVALFIGEWLLTILPDDKPDIPWPNHWDFPGGGREGEETPEQTIIREVQEEVGLELSTDDLIWRRSYTADFDDRYRVVFFVAQLPDGSSADIVFGDEGQEWKLVSVEDYFSMDRTIRSYPDRLRDWFKSLESDA